MKLPSFSIAALMCCVAIAAVDGNLLRQMDLGDDNEEILGAAGIFVMVNVLGVGLLRIMARRGRPGPFLVGFEIAGILAILAYLGCFRRWPDRMEDLFLTVRSPIEGLCEAYAPPWACGCFYQESWDEYPFYLKFPMLFAVLPVMTLPILLAQLSIALVGGRIAQVLSRKKSGSAERAASSSKAGGPGPCQRRSGHVF